MYDVCSSNLMTLGPHIKGQGIKGHTITLIKPTFDLRSLYVVYTWDKWPPFPQKSSINDSFNTLGIHG